MEFKRLLEFCATADENTAQNDIRKHLPKGLQQAPQAFKPYEESLQKLDTQIWEQVKQKLLQRTIKDDIRGWAQFYDTLAEVRGYCFLQDSGYTNVHFIPEVNNTRTPDIEATGSDGKTCLLESKSIGFSDDERKYILENTKRIGTDKTLIVRNVTQGMPIQLKNKIENTVETAKEQLLGYLPQDQSIKRIIYLTLLLDIPMMLDMQNYTEVVNFVRKVIREETEVDIEIDPLSTI